MSISQSSNDRSRRLSDLRGDAALTPPTLRNRMSYFCPAELDEFSVTSISVALANQRRHPGHLAGKEPNRSRGPSTEAEHCDAPFRCNPSVAAPARVTFRKPRAIDMVRHHLRSIRRQGRKAVSPRYALVIHPMEAGLRPGIRDKVGHRLLVVAMKARAEPNQPAAGCR
jgi:hypothetical protein